MSVAASSEPLGRYKLASTLGEGAHGVVYEARDRESGERVALKELSHVSAATVALFKQEFRAVQEVHHPNLVRLDALFEDHGKWMIAMELVDGTDLLSYVYASDQDLGFDELRLRASFLQLAEGLSALHAAGLVHRDLKPSNVRVTAEGRAVLLDFGLATPRDPGAQPTSVPGLGTIAYMAPEQAGGDTLGPPADWYAFGVCLYEALTGVLPIEGETPLALLKAKQRALAPAASSVTPGVPLDLDRLCVSLLAIAPDARPNGASVVSMLVRNVQRSSAPPASSSDLPVGQSSFEGREQELQILAERFARVSTALPQLVLVEGESGIGKSALIERFLSGVQAGQCQPLILRSRCYENALLAYEAFDGAVDELVRVLVRRAPERFDERQAALLCRLFPAFAGVPAFSTARLYGMAADPGMQRLEAFAVFTQLLARLCEQTPIVLAIDDLQWADAESFQLLGTLLGGSQPVGCLVVATVRPRAEFAGHVAKSIEGLRNLSCVTDLPLAGLPRASAIALARRLVGDALSEPALERIVSESAGHPLFLTELTHFAGTHGGPSGVELTLDAALEARIGKLPAKARKLLETVALAASPLLAPLCARAAGIAKNQMGRLVAQLCDQKLLRHRGAGEIACFHDRIRRVAVERLPNAERKALHSRLANVLALQGGADPAELARHYEAAGKAALAYDAYRRGADRAVRALAFARAAALYARALLLSSALVLEPSRRTALQIARGHALACAGNSAEAAHVYLEAAQATEGELNTQLRTWAAQHLLQSARVAEGMLAARTLLAGLGVPLPVSLAASMARLIWDRLCLSVRRVWRRPLRGPISTHVRMQLDALWGLSLPISLLDLLPGAVVSARHLRIAERMGERTHLVRALGDEAFVRMLMNPQDSKADALFVRARVLAEGDQDPALEMTLSFREAMTARFRCDLPRALERAEHAQQVGIERCPDQPWLLTNVRATLASAWAATGEHSRLASACAAWIAEAADRGDRFALAMFEGPAFGFFRHLMANDPDRAQVSLNAALEPFPREPFSFAHFGELIGVVLAELYRGGDGAARWLEREQPRLSRAYLLKLGLPKATLLTYRGYANLAARGGVSTQRAKQLLDQARANSQRLKPFRLPQAEMDALGLESQVLALSGELDAALAKARAGRMLSEQRHHFALSHALGFLEGLLEGGETGHDRRRAALAFYAGQGWKNARRSVAMVCPAIDELEAR